MRNRKNIGKTLIVQFDTWKATNNHEWEPDAFTRAAYEIKVNVASPLLHSILIIPNNFFAKTGLIYHVYTTNQVSLPQFERTDFIRSVYRYLTRCTKIGWKLWHWFTGPLPETKCVHMHMVLSVLFLDEDK